MATISTSETVYVWLWLPRATQPVPAGRLLRTPSGLSFAYGKRYRERVDAVSLSPTLPLEDREFSPTADLDMPGALRDAAPDAWGRRVIANALLGSRGHDIDVDDIDTMTYLLQSGSDRLGAIDFQLSAEEYVPRNDSVSLDELHRAAQLVDTGGTLAPELAAALMHGTSLGGAAPKVTLHERDGREYLAKFSTSDAVLPVVKAEAASIALAARAGIDVPEARLVRSLGRDVLLINRFDRPGNRTRRMVVSALTLTGLGEMTARYGSYLDILASLREYGVDAGEVLFRRIAFNMAISNTDDHLRNHAAFWDGSRLALTPAYDLSPMARSGETAAQAIAYGSRGQRESNFASLMLTGSEYGLSRSRAQENISMVISAVREGWSEAADFANLSHAEREQLWGRQFLNPGALHGFSG